MFVCVCIRQPGFTLTRSGRVKSFSRHSSSVFPNVSQKPGSVNYAVDASGLIGSCFLFLYPNSAQSLSPMEDTESTVRERTTGQDGVKGRDQRLLMSSKPLHRFVDREPRSLGIVILICGCAEILMGFSLAGGRKPSSNGIYIPFWQGILFLVCGILSIFTGRHPSKKLVTVCFAMYLVSIFGILVSCGYRIFCLCFYKYLHIHSKIKPVVATESILILISVVVSVLLILMSGTARSALKSTRTLVIVQHFAAAQSDTTSNQE